MEVEKKLNDREEQMQLQNANTMTKYLREEYICSFESRSCYCLQD